MLSNRITNYWSYILVIVVILISFSAIVGCGSPSEEITADLGEKVIIKIGQNVSIAGEELSIKFVDVVADSRCPTGVTCIWQGEVTCLVDITYAGSAYAKVLTQSGLTGEPAKSDFESYEIAFSVDPYPQAGKEIKDEDYRLLVEVNKKQVLSGGILVTFDVAGEKYSIFITNESTIEQIYAIEQGTSHATIPSGRLVNGSVSYNEPWNWHIDSEDIHMAELTIELCDGTPSQVENNLNYWLQTVQRFCPWGAQIVKIEDFR